MRYINRIRISVAKEAGADYGQIEGPRQAAALLRTIYQDDPNLNLEVFESFVVLFLNRKNQILAYDIIGQGGVSEVVVDSKAIFSRALGLASCSGILLAHNHPSGVLEPGNKDIKLTDKIVSAGRVLDIAVFDHIVLSASGYCSMADDGLVNFPDA